MDIRLTGKNVDITDSLERYIEKKIGKLDRYLRRKDSGEAHVELRHEQTKDVNDRNIVEVTLYDSKGAMMRGEERSGDLFAAIDAVFDKVYRQISRRRGKQIDRYRHGGDGAAEFFASQLAEYEEEVAEEDEVGRIVRVKRFGMAPMSAEEAIEQMELLDHSFFVFYNPEEGNINVVYKRRDDNYGLIIPELI